MKNEGHHDLRGKASYVPDTHRTLPQSPDAERGVLCSFLLAPHEVGGMCEDKLVTEEFFFIPSHADIFVVLVELWKERKPIDFITLTQVLRARCDPHGRNLLDQCGGAAFVTDLFTFLPTAANAAYYLEILAKAHTARQLIKSCTEYAARAYEEWGEEIGDLIDEAQAGVLAINRPDSTGVETIQPIKKGLFEAVNAIEETYKARGGIVGVPTGFHAIDRMTGGMRGPILVVPAGRPSMGKSAWLWNVAEHVSVECGLPVLGFSLEMNLMELASRMLCGRASVNLQRVRDGYLSRQQMEQSIPQALSAIGNAPIYIDETAGLSIQELRVRVRRFIRSHPNTAIVVIDYLQLMSSTSKRAKENRQLEIAEITGGLKRLAKEINRPILAAAQLNREKDGPESVPKLSNLRESGTIEQDADWVLLLHRKHYYTQADEDKGKATLAMAKQRNGPTGPVELVFNNELARFENRPGEELYSNNPEHRQGALLDEEEPTE